MVKVSNVFKDYRTGDTAVHALRGVSLEIEKGEFVALAGASGSGKTTLLNIIGCIDGVTSGDVAIDGVDVGGRLPKQLSTLRREKLGFIFQSFNLIPVLTAYENVAFALSLLRMPEQEVRERTMNMLAEVGLETMADRRPAKLSGGQQQRVAIARALVKAPAIVLADEPTANLDSENGQAILSLMANMNERYKTTFLFSTHDPMVMEFSRRLVSIHDGTIVNDKKK